MDLIEVLWRQDMDLGVGREMFDLNLRRELEKEREVELQKRRDEERELEKLKEQQQLLVQQQLNISFVVDGETGMHCSLLFCFYFINIQCTFMCNKDRVIVIKRTTSYLAWRPRLLVKWLAYPPCKHKVEDLIPTIARNAAI